MQKVQSILNWMSHSPAKPGDVPDSFNDDRNPMDTLNYASLLRVCGTATNAFINLADSSGLTARRLLLLDGNNSTVHVVAEVLIDGRWIIVDPTFRAILRGPDGATLTRQDLLTPAIFAAATGGLDGYLPEYSYSNSVHFRTARFGFIGKAMGAAFRALAPDWQSSPLLSLIVERESLSFMMLMTILMLLLLLTRTSLRWYGEARLGVRSDRIRYKLHRLGRLLLEPAD